MEDMQSFWNALTRRKRNDDSVKNSSKTQLARVLNLFDLTALGVGSTLGLGVYVLAGSVAYEQAGPAVILSFLIAAIASAFAGLCYAEFAARVPKAGSAYVYSYVSVGEFIAFTIGWNLILEYVIGTSSVARGLSGYIDALFDNQMGKYLTEKLPMNIDFLADYPDFFSFFMVLLLAVLLAVGVKESSMLNNIFTTVNILTVLIVLVAGAMKSDIKNWQISKEDLPENVNGGNGGFMPFGIAGVMAGAAKCFYGFVGFDCVATTGEEAINPQRNIPLSIVLSLIIIFLAYFGVSTVLTMMWPYFLQNPAAPFPHVFQEIGWIEIKWIVTIGAIFALCTSLLGAMFPLPRVLYAMSSDGILFRFLKHINERTKTPIIATILSGLLAAIMALLFNLQQLIDMMSIGTLLAYTIVAICVLILRYKDEDEDNGGNYDNNNVNNNMVDDGKTKIITLNKHESNGSGKESTRTTTTTTIQNEMNNYTLIQIIKQIFNVNFLKYPNYLSSLISKIGIVLFSGLSIGLCVIITFLDITRDNVIGIILFTVVLAGMILIVLVIGRQPVSDKKLTFKVPLVPFVPCLSVFINLYLMFQLDFQTWVRFFVWIAIGYLIYFTYGIRNSVEGAFQRKELGLPMSEQSNGNIYSISLSAMPNEKSHRGSYSIAQPE